MKKHNKMRFWQMAFAVCCFLFCLTSCKSLQDSIPEVDPLSVLDEGSSIYFRIPVAAHSDFVKKLLCNTVSGLTEDNADLIIPKINTICAGIGNSDNSGRVQLSADGYFPPLGLKAVLTKNNGWISKQSDVKSAVSKNLLPNIIYSRDDTEFVLGMPSLKNIVLSKDVDPLLSRYNDQYESLMKNGVVQKPSDKWTSNTYEWMTTSVNDIRFCVLRPQAFLASLLGTQMRFAIVCARGNFAENSDGSFTLSLELEFENSLVVKAAQIALKLAFGNNISISQTESTILKIADINFTQEKILQLLGQQINM